jgi:hypothetical protein
MEVAIGGQSDFSIQHGFLPVKGLDNRQLCCIARGIYLLVLSEGAKSYIDALIDLVLGGEGNTVDKIAVWVSSQVKVYTYFPSELTLPLAQRLMQILKQAGDSY